MKTDNRTPSQFTPEMPWFDTFAERATILVSRAPFFAFCILLIILWIPTLFFMSIDSSQLIINTATTIITFLMVALLQNSQYRGDTATAKKLDAIAKALADLMEHQGDEQMLDDIAELKAAVGLEKRLDTKP